MLRRRFPNLPDEKLGYKWAKSYGENPCVSIGDNEISFIENDDGKYCWMINDEQIFDPNLPEQDPLQTITHKASEIAKDIDNSTI